MLVKAALFLPLLYDMDSNNKKGLFLSINTVPDFAERRIKTKQEAPVGSRLAVSFFSSSDAILLLLFLIK